MKGYHYKYYKTPDGQNLCLVGSIEDVIKTNGKELMSLFDVKSEKDLAKILKNSEVILK
jgi:hypothetical protein